MIPEGFLRDSTAIKSHINVKVERRMGVESRSWGQEKVKKIEWTLSS